MTDTKDGIVIEPNDKLDIPEEQKLDINIDSSNEKSSLFNMNTIMEDLSKPKEDYSHNDEDNFLNDGPDDDSDDPDDDSNSKKSEPSENAKKNAEIIGKAIDRLGAFGLSLYAKEENSDYFRMKTSELKMLTEEMESTFSESPDFKMPPYIGLLIVLPVIYMPILKKAKDLRKINEAQAKAKKTTNSGTRSSVEILKKNTSENKDIEPIQDAKIVEDEFEVKKKLILEKEGICQNDECNNLTNKNKKYCSVSCGAKQTNKIRWGKIPKRD